MTKKLLWRIDLLIYRLFYWRWSPRLKADPNLAYVFSKIGSSWTNGNPPTDPKLMDEFIEREFLKYGKVAVATVSTSDPCPTNTDTTGGIFITIR